MLLLLNKVKENPFGPLLAMNTFQAYILSLYK